MYVHDWSCKCSVTMNGPEPISSLLGSKVPASYSFIGRIAAETWTSAASSWVCGPSSSMRAVWSPSAAMSLTAPKVCAHHEPVSGSRTRFRLPTTSLATTGRPLEKAASLRN